MAAALARSLAIAVAVVLALAACGGDDGAGEPAGLSPVERTWVRQLVGWMHGVERAAARGEGLRWEVLGGDAGSLRRFHAAVRPVVRCAARLRERPGPAPTSRLAEIERLVLRACGQFARAVRAARRAFRGNPGDDLAIVDAAFAEGNRLWLTANHELELLATWNRPLPIRGGNRTTSRVEPRFGRVGARFANRAVEVRCWSRRDWPEVYREWQALANDEDQPVAFASSFDRGRLSLDPDVCAGLVRLTYRRDVPSGGQALVDVADAVGVLAHEIEHLVSPASEAVTECRGMQAVRELARALGASPRQAARLAAVYWSKVYPTNPDEYRTAECRDGGPLDLAPDSPVWP